MLSDAISTVGILTFSTDLGAVDGGYIEFGLDESYGLRAPIGVDEAEYRTLLGPLGDCRCRCGRRAVDCALAR